MDLFELTLATPAENLALDEALLDEAEAALEPREALRLWEPAAPLVIVGRNSDAAEEVRLAACRRRGVPVVRRASGGCAIVGGPGCLMYAVILSYEGRGELRAIEAAHRYVLDTVRRALAPRVAARHQGTSDLTLGDVKFSGNSLRCRRRAFLYHGTLLYAFQTELVDELLRMPPRAPDYRRGRSHGAFIANLPLGGEEIRRALVETWQAVPGRPWPRDRVAELVAARYARNGWNERR